MYLTRYMALISLIHKLNNLKMKSNFIDFIDNLASRVFGIRFTIMLVLAMLFGCSKEDQKQTCADLIVDTYNNYAGYWDYCHYSSNEIYPALVYIKTDTINSCNTKFYAGLDSTYCRSFSCPRLGALSYTIRIIVK